MTVSTDESGMLQDLRCHDGNLFALETIENGVELRLRRVDGTRVVIVLSGARYFAANNFLEGNLVDGAYVWAVANAPVHHRREAARAFFVSEELLDAPNGMGAKKLFALDSSYGATVYALVNEVRIIEMS